MEGDDPPPPINFRHSFLNKEQSEKFVRELAPFIQEVVRQRVEERVNEALGAVGINSFSYEGRDAHRRLLDSMRQMQAQWDRLKIALDYTERLMTNREKVIDESRRSAFDIITKIIWGVLVFGAGVITYMFFGGGHK